MSSSKSVWNLGHLEFPISDSESEFRNIDCVRIQKTYKHDRSEYENATTVIVITTVVTGHLLTRSADTE
jgi:hypothetical protein